MKTFEKQAKTLALIVKSSVKISDPSVQSAILDEINETIRVAKIMPERRRRLLCIIHLARGLETSARAIVEANGINLAKDKRNLGGYLTALASNASPIIPQSTKKECYDRVARLRNKVAHGAGQYPASNLQVDTALTSVHNCLAFILR